MSTDSANTVITGLGVSPGVVSGPVARMAAPLVVPPAEGVVTDVQTEVARALEALGAAAGDLQRRAARAMEPAASVLTAQAMMALDPTLSGKITTAVQAGKS